MESEDRDMKNNVMETNETLIRFWDNALALSEEAKEEPGNEKDLDYKSFSPSEKLTLAVESLKECRRVLDYGCGNGWASLIAAGCGVRKVSAVDVVEKGIEAVCFYAERFCLQDRIEALFVSPNWLSQANPESFDGLICSNVLDVVPLETAEGIAKHLSRVLTKGGKAIIGLNFYLNEQAAASRGMKLEDGRYLFVDGVLRLSSLSDEEWTKLLSKYFQVEKLEHFAWPGEAKETRRLFYLSKK